MYADDTKILAKIDPKNALKDIEKLQSDIDKITNWTENG